jgi:hypothetical protein
MNTLALAILSVGTLACIVYKNAVIMMYPKDIETHWLDLIDYTPTIYGIACLISAFV